jgi:hypothetical protein
MKIRFFLIAGCIFFLCVFSSCFNYNSNDLSISVNDNDEEYQLTARFDERKTRAVENYIKECTATSSIFKRTGVTLDDNTKIYIKSQEGRLKIELNKNENSEESYERIKDMCEGIKELLTEN